jgi:xanthine dehydrogenase YagT iron-sulfur-binding subunit
MTRREWVMTSLVAGFALAFVEGCGGGRPAPATTTAAILGGAHVSGDVDVVLAVNGEERTVRIDPRVTLLDALRERMGLLGAKSGCDLGQCGACTVLVDGRRVQSCLLFALMVQGKKITTIEGLAKGNALHPMQEAFVTEDAFQCGYCTAGQIMSAVGLVGEGHAKTDDDIRELMSGNLCRCAAYPNIVSAIRRVKGGAA